MRNFEILKIEVVAKFLECSIAELSWHCSIGLLRTFKAMAMASATVIFIV